MAMTSLTGITFSLLCLFLFSFSRTAARYTSQRFQTIAVDKLLPSRLCDTTKGLHSDEQGKSVLDLIDRHGPCSPFNATAGPPVHDLWQDQSRVDWINAKISSSSSPNSSQKGDLFLPDASTRLPANEGASLGSRNFIVNVGLGTPKKDFSLIFDTGSDLTWVQCSPCLAYCYQQHGPMFAPSASSTYKSLPCSAPECDEAALESGVRGCSPSNICIYGILYGDRSMSVGFLSRDTLSLSKKDVVPSFTFGCGHKNMGLFGMTGGILGLGRSKLSVLSQAGQKYSSIFSYCLPTSGSVGYLTLGPDSNSYTSVRFTPMLAAGDKLYRLSITGMSVGGRMLPIPSSMFAGSGAVVDSGTVITRLPPAVYAALRSVVRTVMAKYKLTEPLQILDTCYDLSEYTTIDYPPIAFHFQGGAELVLEATNIFLVRSLEQVCLAFAANSDEQRVAIIGNWQQKKTLVVHDIAHSRIGFKPNACA